MTPHWTPRHSTSHDGLLDFSPRSPDGATFDAIVVPTNRPVEFLRDCIRLAEITAVPLIVVCSKRVTRRQVIEVAAHVEVFAVDLPPQSTSPLGGITFGTSTDAELLAFTSGLTRDLSAKRNLGLIIARMCGWQRLMFLDDDIYDVSTEHVAKLAAGLDDHNVSVLIPDEYPDNSVVCHANRLGGGEQGKFASAGGMGVRCDGDELSFFPNIYNEDWFFFAEDAANHKIAEVGASRQREYDPFADPRRAVKEEFGDLLAEGLYARLDAQSGNRDVQLDIPGVNAAYWDEFIQSRKLFLGRIAESLAARLEGELEAGEARQIRAAQVSIGEAQRQLGRIQPALCQKFIDLWQSDQVEWRRYLGKLPRLQSVESALQHLSLDYEVSSAPSTR